MASEKTGKRARNRGGVGSQYERAALQLLEEAGFSVTRSHLSRGAADLIAVDRKLVRFIQVKRATTLGSRRTAKSTGRKELSALVIPHSDVVTRELWINWNGEWEIEILSEEEYA
tara:strand:- start:110 stop:454 length:345 start_codon:yes stop_codon:yes gene_type:complete